MVPLRFTTRRTTTRENGWFARCVALTVTLTIPAGCDLFSGGPGGGSIGDSDGGAGGGASGGATLSVPIVGACNGSSVNSGSGGTIRVTRDAAGNVTAKDLIVASSVTSIPDWASGSGAFENYGLTRLTFTPGTPPSLVCIGSHAFSNNRLAAVTIPPSVTTLGEYAFSNNRLTAMVIPSSVTTIGASAFASNSLTTLTIPDSTATPSSLTSIGNDAFRDNRLTTATIPTSVTTIGLRAFADNTGLTTVTLSQTLLNSTPVNAFPGGVTFRNHTGVTITR